MVQLLNKSRTTFIDFKNEEEICHLLERDGIVLVEGNMSEEELLKFSTKLGNIFIHKDGKLNGVTYISNIDTDKDPAKPGLSAFSNAKQDLHTDRSGEVEVPNIIVIKCTKKASIGGNAWFVDAKEVYEDLYLNHKETLDKLSESGSTIFGGSKELLSGSIFSSDEKGRIHVRYRDDELGYFPQYLEPHLKILKEVFQKYLFEVDLKENQGYIIKNDRVLHGRSEFQGERSIIRILVNSCPSALFLYGSKVRRGFSVDY